MKKSTSFIISLTAIVGIFAGSMVALAKDAADIKIGISMPTLQEERWKKDEAMFKKRLMQLGVKEKNILIQSADGNEQKQFTQSENLITQGVDALIIIPQNGEATAPIVKSAHEAGIKVVAVDRIINNPDLDFYVTFDAYEIGVIQGEYIAKLSQSGNWIMIGGAPTDPNAALIRKGQLSVVGPFIDSGAVKVVLDQPADYWNPANALKHVEVGLTKANNNVDVVFTSNDGCAGAAIEALTEQGLAGKIPVPGLDADLAAMQRIFEGTQSMTVYRKLYMQADYAAQAAFALAQGKDPKEAVDVEVTLKDGKVPTIMLKSREVMFAVDKDNAKVVVDDGWLKAEDIFGSLDKSLWPDWYNN